ncbi:hypothetical protein F5148DRAFT_1333018 [Russula earlei]|uniref:Uncharacterized protein n=1 Tax=Russula earlei TaxID=71964 RepID=A0ACC0TX61_9AGAM|nr:hypothetical protein F5148DRAFT_1333018 [Russula earlei]
MCAHLLLSLPLLSLPLGLVSRAVHRTVLWYKGPDGLRLQSSVMERDCVSATRENPLYSHCRREQRGNKGRCILRGLGMDVCDHGIEATWEMKQNETKLRKGMVGGSNEWALVSVAEMPRRGGVRVQASVRVHGSVRGGAGVYVGGKRRRVWRCLRVTWWWKKGGCWVHMLGIRWYHRQRWRRGSIPWAVIIRETTIK